MSLATEIHRLTRAGYAIKIRGALHGVEIALGRRIEGRLCVATFLVTADELYLLDDVKGSDAANHLLKTLENKIIRQQETQK